MTIDLKKLYISRGWRFGQDVNDKKWYVEVSADIDRNDWNYISTENIDYTTLSKLKDTNFPTYIPVAFKKALKLESFLPEFICSCCAITAMAMDFTTRTFSSISRRCCDFSDLRSLPRLKFLLY